MLISFIISCQNQPQKSEKELKSEANLKMAQSFFDNLFTNPEVYGIEIIYLMNILKT